MGPCITGVIDIRNQPELNDGMVVEEGSMPGALAGLMPGALETACQGRRQGYRYQPDRPDRTEEERTGKPGRRSVSGAPSTTHKPTW